MTIVNRTTPGPWHWSIEDYSMACLEGPGGEVNSIMAVTPCKSCQARAVANGPEWEWGRCWTPSQADAALIAAAPALYALAKGYEAFEADLILNGNWDNTVKMTQAQHDWMLELQIQRNAALAAADGKDAEAKP